VTGDSVRILSGPEIARLLSMPDCVEAVEGALRALACGEAVQPLRGVAWLPDRHGLLATMPGYLAPAQALGLKAITVMPGNLGTPFESHQGVVLLFEPGHGRLRAILDASSITAIRTAAASGVATRALAREDAGDLALLGSGVQARGHLDAVRAVRPLRRVRVWSRRAKRARAFAEAESSRTGLPVEAVASARDAVAGADLICTVTASSEPVLFGEWIEPGAHVNAVGACTPAARELDTAAVLRARIYVDRRESALAEAGDLLIPIREGALDGSHVAGELGDVLLGRVPGRRSREEITLFESLGLAVEDLAAAHLTCERAEAAAAGWTFDLAGGADGGC
jgi:ornithine cyclodeaminase/alanine dehydrogenase-like protein (mu-crystallin family)